MQSDDWENDLVSAVEQLVRLLRSATAPDPLSLSAASVLNRLVADGPQRLGELARQQSISQPAMTQLVARLERARLVRRSPFAADARVVLVAVTATGRRLLDRRRRHRARALARLVDGLEPGDRRVLRGAVPALQRLGAVEPRPAGPRVGAPV